RPFLFIESCRIVSYQNMLKASLKQKNPLLSGFCRRKEGDRRIAELIKDFSVVCENCATGT
ncbi:MAG: hypothetical protein LBK58_06960, partial [Prevotellaceae bacterium]|nr:hypothetical protein [Prevotellaceae bacterium]